VTELLQRRQVYSRRRELRALALAGLALLAASACWHLVRPALTLALARSSVGSARSELLADALLQLYPDQTGGDAGLLLPVQSSVLRRGRVVLWRTSRMQRVGNSWVTDVRQHVADGDLRYLGSLRTDSGVPVPCPDGFDAAGGLTLALMYSVEDPRSSGFLPACGIVRLLRQRADVTGVIIGPRSSVMWKDADNDGACEIVFWKFLGRRAGARTGQFQVLASVNLDASGIPIAHGLPADGSVAIWTPPEGVPLPIPDDVNAEDFFRELLPLPAGFALPPSTAPASAPGAPTSTRSSWP